MSAKDDFYNYMAYTTNVFAWIMAGETIELRPQSFEQIRELTRVVALKLVAHIDGDAAEVQRLHALGERLMNQWKWPSNEDEN